MSENKLNVELSNSEVITYIWIDTGYNFFGPNLPEAYKNKLKSLTYPYQLLQQCDLIIEQTEEQLGKRFFSKTKASDKSDLCRTCYLYRHGGTYSDLDYELNYTEHLQRIKKYDIFFASVHNLLDIYYIHVRNKKEPFLLEVLNRWDERFALDDLPHYLLSNRVKLLEPDEPHHRRDNKWLGKQIVKDQLTAASPYFIMLLVVVVFFVVIRCIWKRKAKGTYKSVDQAISQNDITQ